MSNKYVPHLFRGVPNLSMATRSSSIDNARQGIILMSTLKKDCQVCLILADYVLQSLNDL